MKHIFSSMGSVLTFGSGRLMVVAPVNASTASCNVLFQRQQGADVEFFCSLSGLTTDSAGSRSISR
jgi:hypothetical protein